MLLNPEKSPDKQILLLQLRHHRQKLTSFPIQTVAIVADVVTVLVFLFVLVFKKGYITIEVVDEETDEEQNKDGKEGNKGNNPDCLI